MAAGYIPLLAIWIWLSQLSIPVLSTDKSLSSVSMVDLDRLSRLRIGMSFTNVDRVLGSSKSITNVGTICFSWYFGVGFGVMWDRGGGIESVFFPPSQRRR